MKPKDLKRLIFRESKPNIRQFVLMDGDKYSRDAGILWAAYKAGSFSMPEGLTQEEFIAEATNTISGFRESLIIDDVNDAYPSGNGAIGLVLSNNAGMIVEPRFMFFKWANCRNVLRSSVAVLSMIRASNKTGIVLVRVDEARRKLADHLRKYDLLFFIGKSDVNEFLYSAKGRGSA